MILLKILVLKKDVLVRLLFEMMMCVLRTSFVVDGIDGFELMRTCVKSYL